MTTETELTVIVTAHDETLVCGPTMQAADAAIACAEAAGITVERIIVLDNATGATKAWFGQPAFDSWDRIEMEEGDVGRVRNAMIPRTKGRFVAFLDSDDLFSENWLREGVQRLRRAEAAGERAIAHPELNWLFDGAHSVYYKPNQDDPLFTPYYLYTMNYYDSLCMAPREAYLEFPYVHRDIPNGLSFQDWQFSIETMAGGWKHVNARDTIIFKRRRDDSLVTESRARRALVRALDPMAIDRVADLGRNPPPAPAEDRDIPPLPEIQAEQGLISKLVSRVTGATPPPPGSPLLATRFGAGLHDRIARAKARAGQDRIPDQKVYDAVGPWFDMAYYLTRNSDIYRKEELDPLAHYLRAGAREGRRPTPWFGPRAYVERNPDLPEGVDPFHHYLTRGQAEGRVGAPFGEFESLSEMLGLTPAEAERLWRARHDDLSQRLAEGELGHQAERAAEHEPLIGMGWSQAMDVKIPPFHSELIALRTGLMWRLLKAAGHRRVKYVICVNRARFGAAPRVEGHIARALAGAHGPEEVLVITTDRAGEMPPGKLPEGVRHIDFAAIVDNRLRPDPRQRLLVEFLRALRPEAVFNVNSRLMWDLYAPYGIALAYTTRLYSSLLCNEQTPEGYWTGYPLRRFYRHFDLLSATLTDSAFLADELRGRYMPLPDQADRLQVLPNPVDPSIPLAPRPGEAPARRPQIFWAGRMDRQKRVDLVVEIAAALPEADIRLWGEAVLDGPRLPEVLPSNLSLQGTYAHFADLPLSEADLWLYTSAWDGVPSILLEVGMTGVPIVGSDVGGTAEVLRDGMGRRLPPEATAADWAAVIRQMLADPDTARKEALLLRETLLKERTAEAHAAVVLGLPGCAPDPADPAAEVSS